MSVCFDFTCAECGQDLSGDLHRSGDYYIRPCQTCMEVEQKSGFDEGYEQGWEAGKDEGFSDGYEQGGLDANDT